MRHLGDSGHNIYWRVSVLRCYEMLGNTRAGRVYQSMHQEHY
jgi:hypothetical protein